MPTVISTVYCPECCGDWQVTGISGSSINPGATCATTPSLSFLPGCVSGSISDVVAAAVSGSYTVVCQNPLIGDNGQSFENPCGSKTILFSAVAAGAVIESDECSATATISIEDCPEFPEAAAAPDYVTVITLQRCSPNC